MITHATPIDHLSTPRPAVAPSTAPLATAKPWIVCGISRGQWYKLAGSGRTPVAVRLGTRRPVFLIAELAAWLAAGAPDRATWEAAKAADDKPARRIA